MALYEGPNIIKTGLVICLDAANPVSYPGSGTAWNDLSGNNYNTTLTNGPTFTSANGGAIVFDGSDDYAGALTTPDILEGDPNLTICGWFKRTESGITYSGAWGIGGEDTDGGINCWNYANTNEITIDTWNRSTFTSGVTYPLNEWVFAAWQKIAGPMTRANCIIWRNLTSYTGNQLTILRGEGPAPTINNYGFTLGSISRSTGYCVGINIANFYVYNRILTSSEIAQNYNSTKGRFGL
jgi:hypothetical protein